MVLKIKTNKVHGIRFLGTLYEHVIKQTRNHGKHVSTLSHGLKKQVNTIKILHQDQRRKHVSIRVSHEHFLSKYTKSLNEISFIKLIKSPRGMPLIYKHDIAYGHDSH